MNVKLLQSEFYYRTSRSSGAGGQNINKVETKVEILFDITNSLVFTDAEITLLLSKLENKINKNGFISVTCQETRTQLGNKQIAETKMIELLSNALIIPTERIVVTIPKNIVEKRKNIKSKRSQIKKQRTYDTTRIY
jgi:ribosome-associated protein